MKIETKFGLGDVVYFLYDRKIMCGTINEFRIHNEEPFPNNKCVYIEYQISVGDDVLFVLASAYGEGYEYHEDCILFSSREELIASL